MKGGMQIDLISLSLPLSWPLHHLEDQLKATLQQQDPSCELLRWAIVRVDPSILESKPGGMAQIEAVVTRNISAQHKL